MRNIIIIGSILTFIFCLLLAKCARGEELTIEQLVPKIIKIESNGDPNAVGADGEVGLMQISPIVLEEFNNFVGNLYGERGIYWFGIGSVDLLHTSNKAHYGWKPIDKRGWYLRIPKFKGSMELDLYPCSLKEEDLFEPRLNTFIGTWYLNRLKDRYIPKDKYSVEVLLGCYNWGFGNVRKVDYDYKRFPKSVKRYIGKVLK